jgi:predicted esterase
MSRALWGVLAIAGACVIVCRPSEGRAAPASVPSLDAIAVQVPPIDRATAKPMFVAVHGQCEDAGDTCAHWAKPIGDRGFLVCPRGNVTCPSGGATWGWPHREDHVFLGIEAARLAHPGEIDVRATTLIGFSLGAPVALEVASHRLSGFKALVLVASLTIEPDAKTLRDAGIERVVLAAGDFDMSMPHIRVLEKRLRHDGMPTRFVSLGKVGHLLPPDLGARMTDALAWVQGEGPP